jgi:hypothetical protein
MSLLALQRRMARLVMVPLTPSERMRAKSPDGRSMRKVAAQFIKPNDRLTSFERLEIYNRQYWFRVLSCLAEDFPGLRAVVGGRHFDALCNAYLTACPSRSFSLRNLGSRLEKWLSAHPSWTRPRQRLALDMVRLEWAQIEAFDGKAETVLQPEDLADGASMDLRLRLQPYIQLLGLSYPVDDLLISINEESEEEEFASNAVTERRQGSHVRRVAKLKSQRLFLAVHRHDDTVHFRRLEPEGFAMLLALRRGKPIGRAILAAFRGSRVPPSDRAALVREWFETWSMLGWFCRPAPENKPLAPA